MDIRELRKAARITQWELASRTGISRMRLSLAECGYVALTATELAAIQTTTLAIAEARVHGLIRGNTGVQA